MCTEDEGVEGGDEGLLFLVLFLRKMYVLTNAMNRFASCLFSASQYFDKNRGASKIKNQSYVSLSLCETIIISWQTPCMHPRKEIMLKLHQSSVSRFHFIHTCLQPFGIYICSAKRQALVKDISSRATQLQSSMLTLNIWLKFGFSEDF